MSFPTTKFGHSRLNSVYLGTILNNMGVLSQMLRACGPVAPRLSESLSVIESDRDPSGAYDFLFL